jgi:hypothetical protein
MNVICHINGDVTYNIMTLIATVPSISIMTLIATVPSISIKTLIATVTSIRIMTQNYDTQNNEQA